MVEQGRWKQVEPKDAIIVALATHIKNVENRISLAPISSGGGLSSKTRIQHLCYKLGGLNSMVINKEATLRQDETMQSITMMMIIICQFFQ